MTTAACESPDTNPEALTPSSNIDFAGFGLSSSSDALLQRLADQGHIKRIIPHAADLKSELAHQWQPGQGVLVVGSVGAVTRLIAPLIQGKALDPAVLVLDPKGDFVIPLLGGHSSGADQHAQELAAKIGGTAVITGACAHEQRIPIDCFGEGWGWRRSGTVDAWRQLMKDQANREPLRVRQTSGHQQWLTTSIDPKLDLVETDDWDLFIGPQRHGGCSWHPPTLWIGVGCERNTSESLIQRAIRQSLDEAGFAIEAIAGLATADRKADEPALLTLCQNHDWPLRTYKAEQLGVIPVPTPSQTVYQEMGTASVAEAAALLTVGNSGTLRQSKRIHHANESEQGAVTIAIAESAVPMAPNRGELHLIGSGPGDPSLISGEATSALRRCKAWVGYELYLNLLEPLRRPDQIRFDGQLTKEWDRCSEALELASQGAKVALISSGDSGIYGMAGLALELWLQKPEAARPHFQVHPGISALQLAAAKTGAPLMHDFCTISLSDRLTPWEVIEHRIQGAGLGDFVIALYNPRSKGRDWQLAKAKEILLEHRKSTTPVAIARQLGRDNEEIRLTTLGKLNPEQIDMLTVLLIGNSSSYSKDGRMVTPRGYPGAELN